MRDGVTDGGDECRNRNLFLVAIIFPIRIVENTIYVADRVGKKKGDRKQCCLINVVFFVILNNSNHHNNCNNNNSHVDNSCKE